MYSRGDEPREPAPRRSGIPGHAVRGAKVVAQPPELRQERRRGATATKGGGRVIDVLSGFVEELRAAGVEVGITEHVDAMRAVDAVSLDERAIVRRALGPTLAKGRGGGAPFDPGCPA